MNVKRYVKERDAAFLSLDKEKILAFCKRWKIHIPEDENVFWIAVHKIVFNTNSATFEQKQKSFDWLTERGYSPYVRDEE